MVHPNLDLFPYFQDATTYTVILNPGDCLYIPSYWWMQIEGKDEMSIGVTFWYGVTSEWIKVIFHALEA